MLKVLVINDQTTPMEFVVSVLKEIFGHAEDDAKRIVLLAHLNGDAICGVCRNSAEARNLLTRATALSRQYGHSLEFSVVPVPFWEHIGAWLFNAVMKLAPPTTPT